MDPCHTTLFSSVFLWDRPCKRVIEKDAICDHQRPALGQVFGRWSGFLITGSKIGMVWLEMDADRLLFPPAIYHGCPPGPFPVQTRRHAHVLWMRHFHPATDRRRCTCNSPSSTCMIPRGVLLAPIHTTIDRFLARYSSRSNASIHVQDIFVSIHPSIHVTSTSNPSIWNSKRSCCCALDGFHRCTRAHGQVGRWAPTMKRRMKPHNESVREKERAHRIASMDATKSLLLASTRDAEEEEEDSIEKESVLARHCVWETYLTARLVDAHDLQLMRRYDKKSSVVRKALLAQVSRIFSFLL